MISHDRTGIILRKVPNGWMLNYSSTQTIKSVYQFISIQMNDSQCGLSYVQTLGKKMETMNVKLLNLTIPLQIKEKNSVFISMHGSKKLNITLTKTVWHKTI